MDNVKRYKECKVNNLKKTDEEQNDRRFYFGDGEIDLCQSLVCVFVWGV